MARLAAKRRRPDDDTHAADQARRNTSRRVTPTHGHEAPAESPSPAISFSSDKENRTSAAAREARDKSRATSSATLRAGSEASHRRRGLEDRSVPDGRPDARASEERTEPREESTPAPGGGGGGGDPHSILDTRFYDPEQTLTERRPLRKAIRDLTRELQESRHEYMGAHSTGIYETLVAANEQFAHIKQTSDATLDSNLLVKAADLAARRSLQTRAKGAARGIDVGDFAARCAAFMRRGPAASQVERLPADVQSAVNRGSGRGPRNGRGGESEDDDGTQGATQGGVQDDGDELNWAWLGYASVAPASTRPRVPGFLLGPLSLQKKARAATQRAARQPRLDPASAERPAELDAAAIEKVENANLTALCRKIFKVLHRYQTRGQRAAAELHAAQEAALGRDLDADEVDAIRDQHCLRDDGGVCLLHFAFNPLSFGQTVENLFYISFLVRDGKAGLAQDSRGRLSLHPTDASAEHAGDEGGGGGAARGKSAGGRRQAVLHLDFATWRAICREFAIEKCIIGHRVEDGGHDVSAGGWYG